MTIVQTAVGGGPPQSYTADLSLTASYNAQNTRPMWWQWIKKFKTEEREVMAYAVGE